MRSIPLHQSSCCLHHVLRISPELCPSCQELQDNFLYVKGQLDKVLDMCSMLLKVVDFFVV
jgi:hypothetical protein